MNKKWKLFFYRNQKGNCPVIDFIESRSKSNQAKILSIMEQLKFEGPNMPRPYSDYLKDGIHELRVKLSGDETRSLYFFCYKEYVIITNSFIKTSDKVPDSEIELAKKCRNDFLRRYNEKNIKEIEYD